MSIDNLDETKLKAIVVNLERRYNENIKLRIKYADDPAKFAVSETELFATLDEFQAVTVQPELYQVLLRKKVLKTLLTLLVHENKDISSKVISILNELTDSDEDRPDNKAYFDIIWDLADELGAIDSIINNLDRFDVNDKDDCQAIISSLEIIYNMIECDSEIGKRGNPTLADWIFQHLEKNLAYNPTKLSMMELLIEWLRSDGENHDYFCQNGIPLVLRQVDYYRRVAPKSGEESEFLDQCFSCLTEALFTAEDENLEVFYNEEGIDLIELILREKRACVKQSNIKFNTLKLFSTLVTSGNDISFATKCCEQFIKKLGLKVLFPIFQNPKVILNERIKKREYKPTLDSTEECTCGIILALLKHCKNTELIQRVLIKFAESNYEKLDRLKELHEKYHNLLVEETSAAGKGDDTDDEDALISPVNATLRSVNFIILLVCYLGNQFETYDPSSGETLTNRFKKMLTSEPAFKVQVITDVNKHIKVIYGKDEEKNSLELLLKNFEQTGQDI